VVRASCGRAQDPAPARPGDAPAGPRARARAARAAGHGGASLHERLRRAQALELLDTAVLSLDLKARPEPVISSQPCTLSGWLSP